jgi:Dynein heavy chain, N-terminal region 2
LFQVGKPVEIGNEIHIQKGLRDEIETALPDEIAIGPFLISVLALKKCLLSKRTQIIEFLKQLLLHGANKKVYSIQQRYDKIMECVTERALTIEHLDRIAKYITLVPHYVQQLKDEMRATSTDFSILESFIITLPDEIFLTKWKALQMPQNISRQVNETLTQHAIERERFRKLHESDVTVFLQKLETVTDEMEMFLKKLDFDNMTDNVEQMNKIWCYLQKLKEQGELLNMRGQLFELSKIDLETLDKHIERLYPYEQLWTMISNFLMSKEMWIHTPLSELDISITESEMKRYDKIVMECRNYFSNIEVIERISAEMKEFKTSIDIIKNLKNPDLRIKHWNILTGELDNTTKHSPVTTFADLMMRKILEIVDLVKEISCSATREKEKQSCDEIEN